MFKLKLSKFEAFLILFVPFGGIAVIMYYTIMYYVKRKKYKYDNTWHPDNSI